MLRLSKLKAVPAPAVTSGELSRHRSTHRETALPLSESPHTTPTETNLPVWHKDNYGFWLLACVMITMAFSVIQRAFA